MKRFLYPVFAVLTSICLVLGGFSFSAQQGKVCAFEVQRAEAAVPLTAPYIFGALLGCFGVSVAGFASSNGQNLETALNNAWDSFQASTTSDMVHAFQESFALFTSPVMPLSALNITSLMYQAVADWLLHSDYFNYSAVTYPNSVSVSNGSVSFDIPVWPISDIPSSVPSTPFYVTVSDNGYFVYVVSDSLPSFTLDFVDSRTLRFNFDNNALLGGYGSKNVYFTDYAASYVVYGGALIPFPHSVRYVTPYFASLINPSYAPISGPSVLDSNAVLDVPESVSNAIRSGSAATYGTAVEDAVSGLNLNVDSAIVQNPAWSDVFGDISATLESIQSAIESGFAGVLEGVQTFFRPVVEFFAPLDIKDSDDIGSLVLSNANKEHTFTTKFPFCLVNDYKLLYEKAISPTGGSSDYPTPGHFVVKLPSVNGLNSKPVTMNMTYIFTDKYMGLTLGQISQLFVSIACLAMFLHWLGDMINVVKSPNYGYVTVEGEAVGRQRS